LTAGRPPKSRRALRFLFAAVPVFALTLGVPFANRVEPKVFGLPFLLAYIVVWIVLTPAFMLAIYRSEGKE
jgi:hypothetical protein